MSSTKRAKARIDALLHGTGLSAQRFRVITGKGPVAISIYASPADGGHEICREGGPSAGKAVERFLHGFRAGRGLQPISDAGPTGRLNKEKFDGV